MKIKQTSAILQLCWLAGVAFSIVGCATIQAQRDDETPQPGLKPETKALASPAAKPDTNQPTPRLDTKQRERALHGFLVSRGIRDQKAQEAIINAVEEHDKQRQKLQFVGQNLMKALSQKGEKSIAPDEKADAAVAAAVREYEGAVADYKSLRIKSRSALDKSIGYSKDARLRGTLLVLGVIDDAPPLTPVLVSARS